LEDSPKGDEEGTRKRRTGPTVQRTIDFLRGRGGGPGRGRNGLINGFGLKSRELLEVCKRGGGLKSSGSDFRVRRGGVGEVREPRISV